MTSATVDLGSKRRKTGCGLRRHFGPGSAPAVLDGNTRAVGADSPPIRARNELIPLLFART